MVVAFNNLYLFKKNRGEKDLMSYEKLAQIYIKYINLFPQNTYTFVGWSFGGILAFEITRVLLKAGKKIRLILIDSSLSYKYVMDLLNIDDRENINYNYNKKIVGNNYNLEIVLFKATYPSHIAGNYDASNYYARNTADNLILQHVARKYFSVIEMNASHDDWLHKKSELEKIANCINSEGNV